MQPSGSAVQMEAVVKLYLFYFFHTRIVSKELQVIVKVTMNSSRGSKWIYGGGGVNKSSCFTLGRVGFLEKGVAIVSR